MWQWIILEEHNRKRKEGDVFQIPQNNISRIVECVSRANLNRKQRRTKRRWRAPKGFPWSRRRRGCSPQEVAVLNAGNDVIQKPTGQDVRCCLDVSADLKTKQIHLVRCSLLHFPGKNFKFFATLSTKLCFSHKGCRTQVKPCYKITVTWHPSQQRGNWLLKEFMFHKSPGRIWLANICFFGCKRIFSQRCSKVSLSNLEKKLF